MATSAISFANSTSALAETKTAAVASKPEPDQTMFLQLLVAQLKNQNPASPSDGAAFVAQLAQFTTLEQQTQSRKDLDNILQVLQATGAVPAGSSSNQP
jgi:flagellar basal-body rod modification protein FlgD